MFARGWVAPFEACARLAENVIKIRTRCLTEGLLNEAEAAVVGSGESFACLRLLSGEYLALEARSYVGFLVADGSLSARVVLRLP